MTTAAGASAGAMDESTPALLRSFAVDGARLARSELALAKEEIRETLLGLRWTLVALGTALLLTLVSLQLLALTVALSFGWGPRAAIVATLLSIAAAGVAAFEGYRRIEGMFLIRTRRRLHALLAEGEV